MVRRDDALAKLLKVRAGDDPAKLRLSDQKALEGRGILNLEIGQHPQFFQRGLGEVLRLVDNQQGAAASAMGVVKKLPAG